MPSPSRIHLLAMSVLALAMSGSRASAEPAPAPAEPVPDWTWTTGSPRTTDSPLQSKYFTGEFRLDTSYHQSVSNPKDDTIVGSSEVFRSGEFQLTQLGIGGDFHYENVIGRLMTQFGMYAETTPRNDASTARGQWDLTDAYRYLSEAYGGYHLDKVAGVDSINIEAGLFLSYIGLWSYYNFDNWTYQPSYLSSNTPWYFNGARVQIFVNDKLKIEPWIINGWQSYGRFNKIPGFGGQIAWHPTSTISIVGNQYIGSDTLGVADRYRVHTDESVQVKLYDDPTALLDKVAVAAAIDVGCEWGGGVSCARGSATAPAQYFLGFMAYGRAWFDHDHYALTLGGGAIDNPGRYLVLLPPVNGATAVSGPPYVTENPGDPYKAWDMQVTTDYMPSQFVTFRLEFNHRFADVPYFSGAGGVTPPGGNQGAPGSMVTGWQPDLVTSENRITAALMIKL